MNIMKYVLRFKSDSYLKTFPFDPTQLSEEDLIAQKAGDEIPVSDYMPNLQGNHVRVILENFDPETVAIETIEKQYYCLGTDVEIFLSEASYAGEDPQQFPPPIPKTVNLDVPYHTQLNNYYQPYGTCNVTCMAMILKYYGVDSRTAADLQKDIQLEDVLYLKTAEWDQVYGYTGGIKTRHEPQFLIRLLRKWGEKYGNNALQDSYFSASATEADIKQHIAAGNPVVVHGWFTRSGHIIVVKGYDDNAREWICNDPYGHWLGYRGGYDTSASGADVRYNYDDFYRVCFDAGIWSHFPIPRVMRLSQPPIKGAEILKLQSGLKQKGFSVEETGYYDDKTEASVRKFQEQNHLMVDGIAGTQTWAKLFAVPA